MANINQVQLPDGTQYNIAPPASNVPYTNTTSGLSATNTQAAIDEVVGAWAKQIGTKEGATASQPYAPGDRFIDKDGYGSVAITSIASGAALTLNTNYIRRTINEELSSPRLIATAAPDGVKTEGDLVNEIITAANNYDLEKKFRLVIKRASRIYHPQFEATNNEIFSNILHSATNCRIYTMFVSGGSGQFIMRDLITATNSDMSNTISTETYYLYEI